MKTAKEWMPAKTICEVSEEWIKQIQLDAMKEGMRRAAAICHFSLKGSMGTTNIMRDDILSASEQLTERDL